MTAETPWPAVPGRRRINSGSAFEAKIGYSRAVTQDTPAGRWCFVAGTTGYDYAAMTMPIDPADQTRNTIATIRRALEEADMTLNHVYRVRYYLAEVDVYEAVIPALAAAFGDIRPAATMVVTPLTLPEMKIEIEADAFKPA